MRYHSLHPKTQNNSHAPQAAPTEEEAAQRAAVAALNQVAGDRALERVLPKEYVPLWTTLGQQVGNPVFPWAVNFC